MRLYFERSIMMISKETQISIYWFSGTGNSLLIAQRIKDNLSAKDYSVSLFPIEKAKTAEIKTDNVTGFVIPVAMFGTYPFLWDFFNDLPETNGTQCFLVDTLQGYSGGLLGPVKKILKKKGYRTLAAVEIKMPNAFLKPRENKEKDQQIINSGLTEADKFCDVLINEQHSWFDIPFYSDLLSLGSRSKSVYNLYRAMFPLSISKEKCTACKTCVVLCPIKNWKLDDSSSIPVSDNRCNLCQRCIAYCPEKAIKIGKNETVQYKAMPFKELNKYLKNKML
jgi:ferredoxin